MHAPSLGLARLLPFASLPLKLKWKSGENQFCLSSPLLLFTSRQFGMGTPLHSTPTFTLRNFALPLFLSLSRAIFSHRLADRQAGLCALPVPARLRLRRHERRRDARLSKELQPAWPLARRRRRPRLSRSSHLIVLAVFDNLSRLEEGSSAGSQLGANLNGRYCWAGQIRCKASFSLVHDTGCRPGNGEKRSNGGSLI